MKKLKRLLEDTWLGNLTSLNQDDRHVLEHAIIFYKSRVAQDIEDSKEFLIENETDDFEDYVMRCHIEEQYARLETIIKLKKKLKC